MGAYLTPGQAGGQMFVAGTWYLTGEGRLGIWPSADKNAILPIAASWLLG